MEKSLSYLPLESSKHDLSNFFMKQVGVTNVS